MVDVEFRRTPTAPTAPTPPSAPSNGPPDGDDQTHPKAMLGTMVIDNPYYIHPDEFLAGQS